MENKTKPRIGPLDSIKGVRVELARVYRSWRHGLLENEQLRAAVCALKELRECQMASDIESRIEALEAGIERKK